MDLPLSRTTSRPVAASPDSAASSSACPLPEMPAMPRISPELTVSAMSFSSVPNGDVGMRLRPRTVSTGRCSPSYTGASHTGSSRPIIMRARLAAVSSRGTALPVTRPLRRIVAWSHSDWISCSLWLM